MAGQPQFGAATVPGLNPITSGIPNFAQQSLQAQRQAALAQGLLNEGMAPIDYDNRGRLSWTQGLAKMLQTYQGYKMGSDAIKQQAALQTQGMQAAAPLYGFGGQAAAPAPDAGQLALAAGAKNGSIGPTNANAALAAQLQNQAPAAPPAAAPSGGLGVPTGAPLNPFNAPPMLAWLAGQGDPGAQEQMKTFLANQTTTPEIKNNREFGITNPEAKAMAMAKAIKDSKIDYAPGQAWSNSFTGQGGFSPKVPDYTQPNGQFTPGSPIASVAPVQGAIPAAAATAGAEQGSREASSIKTVTLPDGSSYTDWGGKVAGTRGQGTSDAEISKNAGQIIANAPSIVTQSKSAVVGLENALKALDSVQATGPGTAKTNDVLAALNNAGIPINKKGVEGYQEAQKYMQNALSTASHVNGSNGSDARFDQFMHGQPNGETLNIGPLRDALRYVLSQHDAAIAGATFMPRAYSNAKAQGAPDAALAAQQQWGSLYNPRWFEIQRLPEAQQMQAVNKMTPQEAAMFSTFRKNMGSLNGQP